MTASPTDPADPADRADPATRASAVELTGPGLPFPVVLFDLDGTLVDSIALILDSYRQVFAHFGVEDVDPGSMRPWIGLPLEDSFRALDPARAEAMTAHYREVMLAAHDAMIRPCPGAAELVRALDAAGARQGVVTSKRRELARRGMVATGLPAIDLVIGQEDSDRHKPDPAPLRIALEHLGTAPAEAVYVGDAPTDLRAAHAAGMAAIGVTWGAADRATLEAERPRAVVEDMAALRALLLPP